MEKEILLSEELISNKIYFNRNQKVMLDRDLATLYGIETRVLKQVVKRNISRFPENFMFELNKSEFEWQVDTAGAKRYMAYLMCRDHEIKFETHIWKDWDTNSEPIFVQISRVLCSGGAPSVLQSIISIFEILFFDSIFKTFEVGFG